MNEGLIKFSQFNIDIDNQAILKDISFNVPLNSTVMIVGQSGSGKSTLLKSILQLLNANVTKMTGDIIFDGQSLLKDGKDLMTIRGKEIGMIFQNAHHYFNPRLKIKKQYIEILHYHFKLSKPAAYQEAYMMLEKLGLDNPRLVLESYPFELSGGMAQRVAIAMSLSLKPKLLLADEPTSALDVTTQSQIMKELMKLKQASKTTLLMVTHNILLAQQLADYIIVMKDGQIIEQGNCQQICQSPQHPYTKLLLAVAPRLEEV